MRYSITEKYREKIERRQEEAEEGGGGRRRAARSKDDGGDDDDDSDGDDGIPSPLCKAFSLRYVTGCQSELS